MLKQRVITALVLVSVLAVAIIYLPFKGFAALVALIIVGASWEWSLLAGIQSKLARFLFSLSSLILVAAAAWYCQFFSEQVQWLKVRDVLGLGCLWWALALLWVKTYPASSKLWGAVFIRIIMGYLVLVPTWVAFVSLRLNEHGIAYLFILIGLVACSDIGAYFSGKAWGKSKLAVDVSPGKSWVGFWGGLASCCFFALLMWLSLGDVSMALAVVVVIALLTGLASVLGDLVESMVKRFRGVKDSGSILPGHGGIMDRMDSLTAAAPVFALCILLVGW
ncbi:MAG: phosphatidate cytidylyltransferase [Pseudohongiellaceae bacterium]